MLANRMESSRRGARSWKVNITDMMEHLQQAKYSIYRVPEYVKEKTNRDAYRPRLFSLGPFHYGDSMLLHMEAHKLRAVVQFVKRSGRPLEEFISAVEQSFYQLRNAYENLNETWQEKRFVELMVTDGCFFLEVMRMFSLDGKVEEDYGSDDPIFSRHGYLYLRDDIISDMLLIENQLPLLLLRKLISLAPDPNISQDDEHIINYRLHTFLGKTFFSNLSIDGDPGLHPLDIIQKRFRAYDDRYYEASSNPKLKPTMMHPASELHEAGIHFQVSKGQEFTSVDFRDGVLKMPEIHFSDNTESVLLNLMAFEKLHPGAGNNVTAFVYFLDILVDTPKDVALLRSKGIIENSLGSDKEVTNLINNTLSKGAFISPINNLNKVIMEVRAHCMKPRNKWRAIFMHTYFSNPWVIISLIAASILVIATIMQTIYTVISYHLPKKP